MDITVRGTTRLTKVTLESLIKHKDVIEHWVDGGEVEIKSSTSAGLWYKPTTREPLSFSIDIEYRPKTREPKAGEIWSTQCGECILIVNDNMFVWFEECEHVNCVYADVNDYFEKEGHGTFIASSIEQYYAQKFLKDCDHDLEGMIDMLRDKL